MLTEDFYHPILRNHPLRGNYRGYNSINITGDWRALFSIDCDYANNIRIIFKLIGTHSQLYE